MNTILVELFKHNLWANLCLLDACQNLTAEQLAASAPGTYGGVGDTLWHLCRAEERYYRTISGRAPEKMLREYTEFPGIDVLRERARLSGEGLIEAAAQADPGHVLTGEFNGEPYSLPIFVPFVQAINHATEHRTHVVTILSQNGWPFPTLDGWSYLDSLEA